MQKALVDLLELARKDLAAGRYHAVDYALQLALGAVTQRQQIEQLKAIEQARQPQWISVSERLPKEDSRVLITGWEWNDEERGERFVVMSCYALGTWWAEGREGVEEFYPPTHWLEVPPLPTKSA